jgi:hypothetical protein
MSKGYHQYGIEWDARAVNLEPIREETRRIVEEESKKQAAKMAADSNLVDRPMPQLAAHRDRIGGPMTRETRPTPAPAAATTPAAESRSPGGSSWQCWRC